MTALSYSCTTWAFHNDQHLYDKDYKDDKDGEDDGDDDDDNDDKDGDDDKDYLEYNDNDDNYERVFTLRQTQRGKGW